MSGRLSLLFRKFFVLFFALVMLSGCSNEDDTIPLQANVAIELLDQPYGEEPIQSLDIYLPEGRSVEKTPLLLYIHGGAWISGNKNEFAYFKTSLEEMFPAYAFVSIGYRLFDPNTRKNQFPAQQLDIKKALEYIVSKTKEWDVSDKIILAGASAGGHLALLQAYKYPSLGKPKAVIAFFPPTDLARLYGYSEFTKQGLSGLLGGSPVEVPDEYAMNSPITYIKSTSAPTIFFHGLTDLVVPISQSEFLAYRLSEAEVMHEFVKIPDQGHGFMISTYPPLFAKAADFVEKVLN